jgi:hypothetical protein
MRAHDIVILSAKQSVLKTHNGNNPTLDPRHYDNNLKNQYKTCLETDFFQRLRSMLLHCCCFCIFFFWILPQGWNEDNTIDGSWRYALGKFRGLGFSLGKDSWFTYGPLAHWFAAPMGTEQYQPFPYYILMRPQIVRGFNWTVIPITWRNRRTGEAKLKIKEMGSRYLFICLYIWLEKCLARGDYKKQ